MRIYHFISASFVVVFICGPAKAALGLTVSAAASLKSVMQMQISRFQQINQSNIKLNSLGSHTLAQQIIRGAPVDIFLSADHKSFALVAKSKTMRAQSSLLGNRLVVVARKDPQKISWPVITTLAIGGRGVPIGEYARQALSTSGLTIPATTKLAYADHARGVISMVSSGAAQAGIVYQTDAILFAKRLHIIRTLPETSHEPIIYWLGLLSTDTKAKTFYRYLLTDMAKTIFEQFGFRTDVPNS